MAILKIMMMIQSELPVISSRGVKMIIDEKSHLVVDDEDYQLFQALNVIMRYCGDHRIYDEKTDITKCKDCQFLKNEFCGLAIDFLENFIGIDIKEGD